jgi:hypothetical protein
MDAPDEMISESVRGMVVSRPWKMVEVSSWDKHGRKD